MPLKTQYLTPRVLASLLFATGIGVAHSTTLDIKADQDIQSSVRRLHWDLDGPFAKKSIELTLRNPHNRPLEATVHLPLAGNERLQGYALDVDGQLRDAVPVERVKARTVFEETVRRDVDPALAQKSSAGNTYQIRVFPIPPRGERRLRIDVASLANRSTCGWQHVLETGSNARDDKLVASLNATTRPQKMNDAPPLNWVEQAGRFSTAIPVPERGTQHKVCLRAPIGNASFGMRFDDGMQMDWLEIPVVAPSGLSQAPLPRQLEIVWDASLSTAGADRRKAIELIEQLLTGRESSVTLTVLRHDISRSQWQIAGASDVKRLLAKLSDEPADGATNLANWTPAAEAESVVIFSDLISTLPQANLPQIDKPVYVVGQGSGQPALARWLVRNGGKVLDLDRLSTEAALIKLRQPPIAQAVLGPLEQNWHVGEDSEGSQFLRACHIANAPAAIPVLSVRHARPDASTELRRHKAIVARAAPQAAFWCATWWAEELEVQAERHRSQLAVLGERFGIVNAETSLLVLERENDYVRHGILPPQADVALCERVLQQRVLAEQTKAEAAVRHRSRIEEGWNERLAWWKSTYPKDDPRPRWAEEQRKRQAAQAQSQREQAIEPRPVGSTQPKMASVMPPVPAPALAPKDATTPGIGMRLQTVPVNAPYTNDLRTVQNVADLYPRYLDLRLQYGQSPAFYFDVAERLFELGDPALGWQVLSNAAELLPRDHATLRLVAYRLLDAGLRKEAEALLRKVITLAPDEPQSFRDLALALQGPSQCQEALDLLRRVVDTPWDPRFADIGLSALAEHNDLQLRCPDARPAAWPEPMQQALPVGLRVVLRWDLNDTDIDLHVTDPNTETAYFAHPKTYQGGLMSRDFTAGYGPEEFILREPKPGEYTVAVKYYGSRLARLTRGAVINLTLQTGFGTPEMRQQTVSMRLLEKSGLIPIGGFTVQPNGELVLKESTQ